MAEKNACDGQYYTPPPKLGKWEGFSIFLWNSETSQFMGRTAASWGKILLFYVLFYTCLIGFFSAMLTVFYQTLDMKIPKWQLEGSLIGNNPGLGFRPMPPESNVESTLIWYRKMDTGSEENWKYWTNELDNFLNVYPKPSPDGTFADNIQQCNYGSVRDEGKVCLVNPMNWKPCNKDNHYNYQKGAPCIFLKLNKIFNWQPKFYNTTQNLPKLMPPDLQAHIVGLVNLSKPEANTVWVSCEGENPADVENMGPIQYIPTRGYPGYFFPFQNQEGYLSPLVAIFFERPATGVLINIECKAWAHNINHDRHERRGSVHFELMID